MARDEFEALGLGAYVFDLDESNEPTVHRTARPAGEGEPERPEPAQCSADELIAQLRQFDDETERIVELVRSDRALAREKLEHEAAEALRREHGEHNDDG